MFSISKSQLLAALLTPLLACSTSAVGAACDRDDDCDTGLVCDVHEGSGTCQEPHTHEPLALPDDATAPSVSLRVARDASSGWNLQLDLANFEFAPERASMEYRVGEGHAHLYVNGTKLTRLYGPWYHLPDLEPGVHQLRVELSGNDHSTLWHRGAPIDSSVTIEQPEPDAATPDAATSDEISASNTVEVADAPLPTLNLEVVKDPATGWNLRVDVAHFRLAPEHASGEHVMREGTLELFVDGENRGRLYDPWYYLPPFDVGVTPDPEIRVELRTNDRRIYTHQGAPIGASGHLPPTP